MKNKFYILITILSISLLLNACGGTQPTANNSSTNAKPANTNSPANVTNSGVETSKKPEAVTTNNAPTITAVVNAYYEALKKKDDAGLKKVFSAETLKSLEADMKEEKQTSLATFITELEPAPEKAFEVRNEKIEGDKAVAEIKGGVYVNWTPFKFVKENGEWKLTNESPDFDDVKNAANSANSAK